MSETRIYCVDIGNTRTHCALVAYENGRYDVLLSDDYKSAEFADVFVSENLFEKSGAEAIAWCSVVPKYSETFKMALKNINAKAHQLTAENSPIEIDLKNPFQVGQDRIAGALGARIFFEPPYVSVDMGTAVTVDFVDKNGKYAGGAIAPGMHAFTDYLADRAAQLPKINPANADYDIVVGRNTEEAMYVGCLKGFCRLIDGILSDIEKEYFLPEGITKKTIFTGGSVCLLPKKWLADRKVEPNLAHLGLAYFYILKENKL